MIRELREREKGGYTVINRQEERRISRELVPLEGHCGFCWSCILLMFLRDKTSPPSLPTHLP